jgi:hypothetical protein
MIIGLRKPNAGSADLIPGRLFWTLGCDRTLGFASVRHKLSADRRMESTVHLAARVSGLGF